MNKVRYVFVNLFVILYIDVVFKMIIFIVCKFFHNVYQHNFRKFNIFFLKKYILNYKKILILNIR